MSNILIKKLKINSSDKELVNISFDINSSTALIGESGSGKSLSLKSILNLLPNNLSYDLEIESDINLDKNNIGFVPQNPFTSLSPMSKIGTQFFCKEEKKLELLKLVGLDSWVVNRFPSQLSGGQLQRVVIAIAISKDPKLLLLDEPTTALDSNSKTVIIELLKDLKKTLDLKMLYVTHDISSIETICEDIVILKDGQIIEKGTSLNILKNPENEYTINLIGSNFANKEFRE